MKYLETFIDALVSNIQNNEVPDKLDIVMEGGAMNGACHIGAMCYLKALEKEKKTKIMRISGVSCGALIGATFLLLDIKTAEKTYLKLANSLLSTGKFSSLETVIHDLFDELEDEKIQTLTNKLYISYIELNTQKRVIISEYKNKNELCDLLLKSAFLPGLIDGSITTNDKCIDGGIPYIFPNDIYKRQTPEYKTLYLRLLTIDTLKDTISTKGELNMARRALDGIQYTHDLFKQNTSNSYASIVENWTKYEIIQFTLLRLVWWIIMYLTFFVSWFYNDIIPTKIKEHKVTLRAKSIFEEIWHDYITRLLN